MDTSARPTMDSSARPQTIVVILAVLALIGAALMVGGRTVGLSPAEHPLTVTTAGSAADGEPTAEIFTAIVGHVLAAPIAAPSTDGQVHLAYEVQLLNALSQGVTITDLVIEDQGQEVSRLAGDSLAARTVIIGQGPGSAMLPAGRSAQVLLDLVVAPDAVPRALTHRITVAPDSPSPPTLMPSITATMAPTTVDLSPSVVVGSPVRGSSWLDANGCCDVTPHRLAISPVNGRLSAPERFAIDLVRLDAAGRVFDGPIDELSSYGFYGDDIVAVADGPVVSLRSDLPDERPGAHPTGLTLNEYGGNFVVQDIGQGRFAFYAHLQPGNPAGLVVGQQLTRGEVIAQLGNSGNTDTPHLHFHVMDSPRPLDGNGLPFRFDNVTGGGVMTDDNLQACLTAAVPCVLDSGSPWPAGPVSPLYRDAFDVR